MSKSKLQKGFTLIEVIVYITLFSFIMIGSIISVYAIFGSNARSQTKAMVQEEGSFLLGKIDWVLSGISNASVTGGVTLSVTKYDTTIGNPVVVSLNGSDFLIKRGGGSNKTLNNSNTEISCPSGTCFIHTNQSADGINPESIEAKFTVTSRTSDGLSFSQDFSTIKYLRK